jgi:hypothetical protein
MTNEQHPIARLIAAAHLGAGELAIVAQAIAKEARQVHMAGADPNDLMGRIKTTLPPYDPSIHGVTRPGVWVGRLADLCYEDSTEICDDAVIGILEPLVSIWGEGYHCPSPSEAIEIAASYTPITITADHDLIVEIHLEKSE